MLRARLTAVVAAGLGLVCGCSSLRDHPWFSRARGGAEAGCCDVGAALPVADGPILEGGPMLAAPEAQGQFAPTPLPPNGQPPADRLVPQPQAQPYPAQPSGRTPRFLNDRLRQ